MNGGLGAANSETRTNISTGILPTKLDVRSTSKYIKYNLAWHLRQAESLHPRNIIAHQTVNLPPAEECQRYQVVFKSETDLIRRGLRRNSSEDVSIN